MNTPLALLALCLALPAAAVTPAPAAPAEPASKAVEEPPFYYETNGVSWWGDLFQRKDIYLVSDMGNLHELCMIPPAADWINDGAPPEIQKKYLNLIWRAGYAIANAQGKSTMGGRFIGTCGTNSSAPFVNIGEFSNWYNGVQDKSTVKYAGNFSSCRMSQHPAKLGSAKYASRGKTISNAGAAVRDTVNQLIRSKEPEVALSAMSTARIIAQPGLFVDSLEAVAKDKSITAKVTINPPDEGKETLPLRVYAMRTLITMARDERSAKVLGAIWHDKTEPEEIRAGAMRAFAFGVQWPSAVGRPEMQQKLYAPFLFELMAVNADENDKKDEAGPKAKLSELGEAAYCAATMYPKAWRDFAKKGLNWDGKPMSRK